MAGAVLMAAPAIASIAGSAASIAGSAFGSSNAQDVQLPQMFMMPNMRDAANNAFEAIGKLPATNYGNQFLPQYEQATQSLFNNPYAAGAQQGAIGAGALGQQQALGQYGVGQGITQAGQTITPLAQQIAATAFDPQNALYARTLQQLQDQVRAGEAARGVATTPYGAGIENKALSDFNIDWANQQLQRQIAGGQATSALTGQGAAIQGAGQQLASQAPALFQQASQYPYLTGQQIGTGQQSAISNLLSGGAQAQGLAATPIQQYLAYLGVGNQAGGVANQLGQLGLNQANLGFNQNQTLGSNLGAGLQGLSNAFGGGGNNMNWLNSVFSAFA